MLEISVMIETFDGKELSVSVITRGTRGACVEIVEPTAEEQSSGQGLQRKRSSAQKYA